MFYKVRFRFLFTSILLFLNYSSYSMVDGSLFACELPECTITCSIKNQEKIIGPSNVQENTLQHYPQADFYNLYVLMPSQENTFCGLPCDTSAPTVHFTSTHSFPNNNAYSLFFPTLHIEKNNNDTICTFEKQITEKNDQQTMLTKNHRILFSVLPKKITPDYPLPNPLDLLYLILPTQIANRPALNANIAIPVVNQHLPCHYLISKMITLSNSSLSENEI